MKSLKALVRRADRTILEHMFPSGAACLVCGCESGGEVLCADCARELALDRVPEKHCPRCGHPLTEEGDCVFCARCPIEARSAWLYGGIPAKLVSRLKFGGRADAADVLAAGTAEAARELALPPDTVVTWVTMPKRRKAQRGIDHGRVLAEKTAAMLGIECRQLLVRTHKRDTGTQRGRTAQERESATGRFACPEKIGGTVLLVDDVMTTGSTARDCLTALERAGAARAVCVTATVRA